MNINLKKLGDVERTRILTSIDSAVQDRWYYDQGESADLYQRAWARFYRKKFGNEKNGFSEFVGGLIQRHLLHIRSYVAKPYENAKGGIVKFPNKEVTEYVNHFWNEIDGVQLVRDLTFNGMLLGNAVAMPFLKEMKGELKDKLFASEKSKKDLSKAIDMWFGEEENKDFEITNEYEYEEDGVYYNNVTYKTKDVSVPCVDNIATESYFITRFAEGPWDAQCEGVFYKGTISDIKRDYPDAYKAYKTKNIHDFLDMIKDDYEEWFNEDEKRARWLNTNTNYSSYPFDKSDSRDAGEGARQVILCKAQMIISLDDKKPHEAVLCQVVKVGNIILDVQEIDEKSIIQKPIIEIPNKWRGMTIFDLLINEEIEATIHTRMVSDGLIQSQHPNAIVDQTEVNTINSILNREPNSVITKPLNDYDTKDGNPIDIFKLPGPDSLGLEISNKMQENAGVTTGAGKFFQPSDPNQTVRNISTETANIIENNSNLMLDDFANRIALIVKDILMHIYKIGRAGGSPIEITVNGHPKVIDPQDFPHITSCTFDIIPGQTDREKKVTRAMEKWNIINTLTQGEEQGGNAFLASKFSEKLFEDIAVEMLEALEVENPEEYLKSAEEGGDQQAEAIELARQEGMQMGLEQARNDAVAQAETERASLFKAQAEAAIRKVVVEEDRLAMEAGHKQALVEQGDKKLDQKDEMIDQADEKIKIDNRKVDAKEEEIALDAALKREELEIEAKLSREGVNARGANIG